MPSQRIFRIRQGIAGTLAAIGILTIPTLIVSGLSGLVTLLWLGLGVMGIIILYYIADALDGMASATASESNSEE